jgi:hypothetical protein
LKNRTYITIRLRVGESAAKLSLSLLMQLAMMPEIVSGASAEISPNIIFHTSYPATVAGIVPYISELSISLIASKMFAELLQYKHTFKTTGTYNTIDEKYPKKLIPIFLS